MICIELTVTCLCWLVWYGNRVAGMIIYKIARYQWDESFAYEFIVNIYY